MSSLIISGQITREDALLKMEEELYSEAEISFDIEYIAKKLDWSVQEFKKIIDLPKNHHRSFPTSENLFKYGIKAKQIIELLKKRN